MIRSYHAHGLRIDSDIELHGFPLSDPTPADLRFVLREPKAIGVAAPDGDLVLESGIGGPGWVAITLTGAGWVIRYPGFAEFHLSADRTEVDVYADPGLAPEWLGILAIGNPLALWVALEGDLALHASAVVVRGITIAFAGSSGMGKSTLACSMARSLGALVVGDDLLRISCRGVPMCFRGAGELRLRAGNRTEALADSSSRRVTVDQRIAVRAASTEAETLSLDVIVLPRVLRDVSSCTARRLAASDALFAIVAETRLVGWVDPAMQRRQFEGIADLVERVPVLEVEVPWEQFDQGHLEQMVDAIIATARGEGTGTSATSVPS